MRTLRLIIAVLVVGAGLVLGVVSAALSLTLLLPFLLLLGTAWGLIALIKTSARARARRQT